MATFEVMSASISSTAPLSRIVLLQHPDLFDVELGVAEQFVEQAALAGRESLAGDARSSIVRLPSRRSSPLGLPVTSRVAEHAEQVVAQLVGDAERQTEGAQRRELSDRSAAEGGADHERCVHAVLGRLVGDDGLGARAHLVLGRGPPGPLLEDVEVLAARDLGAHPDELRAAAACGVAVGERLESLVEQFVAPAEQQVAVQDRGGAAELGGARPSPTRGAGPRSGGGRRGTPRVSELSMMSSCTQRGGVEDLERRCRGDDGEQVGGTLFGERVESAPADRLPPPVAEQRPEALATAEKVAERSRRAGRVRG